MVHQSAIGLRKNGSIAEKRLQNIAQKFLENLRVDLDLLMLNSSVSHEPATRQIAARHEETQILAIPEAIPSTHRELRPPEPTGSVRYYYRQVLHTQSQCCTVTHNSQSIADSRVGECLVQRPSYPSMRKRALVLTTQTS